MQVLSESFALGGVAGAVHDQRPQGGAGGVADLAEQVAVGGDLVRGGVSRARDAAAVQDHDGGLVAGELGLLGRCGLGAANARRTGGGCRLAQVVSERVAEDDEGNRGERDELDRGDGADGDRRPAPGADHVGQVVRVLHRPERVRPARPPSFNARPTVVSELTQTPTREPSPRTCNGRPRRGLSPTRPTEAGPRQVRY